VKQTTENADEKKLSWTRLNSACCHPKQYCVVIIVHLDRNFIKCWCLPLTKGVQNGKKHAKNKILLKKLIQKQQSVDPTPANYFYCLGWGQAKKSSIPGRGAGCSLVHM